MVKVNKNRGILMSYFSIIDLIKAGNEQKICIPITEPVSIHPDLFEFRADLCEGDPLSVLASIKAASRVPVIVTNRGGDYVKLIESGLCDLIDVDIRENRTGAGSDTMQTDIKEQWSSGQVRSGTSEQTVLELAHAAGIPVIISYHDYGQVPDDLDEIAARLRGAGAELTKLACMAHTEEDVDRMIAVDADIAIAMGEIGARSRKAAKYMTYQAYKTQTALGQQCYTA